MHKRRQGQIPLILSNAAAKVNAAKKCYSNDTRLIEAAGYFGVETENILQ